MNEFIYMTDDQLNNYAFRLLAKRYGDSYRLTYKRFCTLWDCMDFLAAMQARG